MSRVYRVSDSGPRSLLPFERLQLEEIAVSVMEAEGIDPVAIRDTIMAEARHEAECKVQEAYAEGMRRGIEAGKARFAESVAESAAALQAASEAMRAAHDAFLDSLTPQLIELAGAIARRILQRESKMDPDLALRTARRALEQLVEREAVVLHVNPKDADALRAQKIALLDEFDGVRQITVMSDPEIAPGGCLVETEKVHVDARIDAQLDRILDDLHKIPEPPAASESLDEA